MARTVVTRGCVDAGCVAVLLAMNWRLLHGLERVLDLTLWDEADYLRRGLTLSWSHLPAAEWGPLYSLWYTALSRLWPEPTALHFANLQVLGVLTSVGFYVFTRRMGARPVLALLGSAVYLLSWAPHVQPRPTLLALLLLELALIAASFLEAPEGVWGVIAGGLLLASFARPELFVAFLLALALSLAALARSLRREPRSWRERRGAIAAWSALGGVLLLQLLGNPFGDTRDRRFYAFCQHFAFNHVRATHAPVDPWNECPRVIHSVFGDVHTVGQALRANPDRFLWHVGVNVRDFPDASLTLFTEGPGHRSATKAPWGRLGEGPPWPWLLGAVGAVLLWRGRPPWTELAGPAPRRMAWVLALVELPTLISAILLRPRAHYLVLQGVCVLALLVLVGSRVGPAKVPRPVGALLGVGLALGLLRFTPSLADHPSSQEHLDRVRALAALGLEARLGPDEQLPLLEAHGGYDAYLGPRYYPVLHHSPGMSFGALLREREVGAILLDEALRTHPRFLHDAQLQAFEAHPEDFGFTRVPLAGPDETLALRASGPVGWSRAELARH